MNFKTETKNKIKSEKFTKEIKGHIEEYTLKLAFENKITPETYSIIWEEDQIDTHIFWSSKNGGQRNITPDWWMRREDSRTASGMPLISLLSRGDINRMTIALSDTNTPTALSVGVVEETGRLQIRIDLFSVRCAPIDSYEIIIRIDRRSIPFCQCVKDVRKWWSDLGYECATVPENAKLPMYSTWYSFHQHTIPSEIIEECKTAKEYGMDTVIVDDGWQTDDNSRGYAFCGDWQVCENKIPDMKRFVDEIHKLGMKFMIWFSVPFMGYESKNYKKFEGMYLRTRDHMKAKVLDPRFKEVRNFLTDIYASSVEKYGWDGLKLDFIDSFMLEDCSSTDYDRMDTVSLEDGLQKLLCEAMDRLKAINPDIMIEFRQSYVGPAISKYGNIFRVGDCPNDPVNNRLGTLDLRLTSGNTVVHSDMIMWNKNDSNEGVMHQLLAVVFAVPQISVRFENITYDHKKLLFAYLDFWRSKRDIILDGEFSACGVESNYTMAQSIKDGHCVAVLYEKVVKSVSEKCEHIFNSTASDGIYVELDCDMEYTVYDIFGRPRVSGIAQRGVCRLDVMSCERVSLQKIDE